jgi:hypothetical protein
MSGLPPLATELRTNKDASQRESAIFDHFVSAGEPLAAHGIRSKHLIHVKRGVPKNVR